MQSLVYCFGAQCAPLKHSFATVLSSRSQRVWWFHIVVVNDVSGMAGRARAVKDLHLSTCCIFSCHWSITHVVPLPIFCQVYSHTHPAIGFWSLCCFVCLGRFAQHQVCDKSAYLHKVSNLSTSFHNSVACASCLLLIACVFSSALLFFPFSGP